MTVTLAENIQSALRRIGDYYAVLPVLGNDGKAAVIIKAPRDDVEAWRRLPVLWRWELGLYPTAAVVRLYLAIINQDRCEFDAEAFLDPADAADRQLLDALVRQGTIAIHFFDLALNYQRSSGYRSHAQQAPQIAGLLAMADDHLAAIPPAERDFVAAKEAMMRDRPMAADQVQRSAQCLSNG